MNTGSTTKGECVVSIHDMSLLGWEEIRDAIQRLDGFALHTFVHRCRQFDEQSGCFGFFKSENMQRSGSAAFRGIANKMVAEVQQGRRNSIYSFHSGDAGIAIAMIAKMLDLPATAILPDHEEPYFLDVMRAYGTRIVLYDHRNEDPYEVLNHLSKQPDQELVLSDLNCDPLVVAGAATVAVEFLQEYPQLECLVLPLCDRTLLAGCVAAIHHLNHPVQICGVETDLGKANGLALSDPGKGNGDFAPAPSRFLSLCDEVLFVHEDCLIDTMLFLLQRMKLFTDLAGAAGACAVRFRKADFTHKQVGILLTSGNMDLARIGAYATRKVRNPLEWFAKERYAVRCYTCSEIFDAMEAIWCNCLAAERTLVCPVCMQCFCRAPVDYSDEFWTNAPQELWDRRMEEHRHQFSPRPNPEPSEVKRPLVLVVDDEPEIQRVAVRVIEELGYGTILAEDGQKGLRYATLYAPDLIITAALLPKVDGREMCRRIKSNPITASIKVIISTALYTQSRHRAQAFRDFHVDEYVNRPLSLNQFQTLLQKYLG